MELNKKYVCSVGYYTNRGVSKVDEENVELSSYNGKCLNTKYPKCCECNQEMKPMLYLHCPIEEDQTRHMSIFYCPHHLCFRAFSSIQPKQEIIKKEEKTQDEGFSLIDIDDSTFASLIASQPKKEVKKKKLENCCGKWIEWYEEYKTIKEFNDSELEKIKEFKSVEEENSEDEFESVSDPQWEKFITSMNENPKQIVRYGGEPLLINESNKKKQEEVHKCSICGNELLYEFEILPSIISLIKDIPEFGALLVYSCEHCFNGTESNIIIFEPNE
ncbi:programmed cell death protein 2 domain containing protein [Entamoeba histolytica HM-1:IMSS-B]|uniref:Programmed cell death protein 2 C-terminal domain-containing protein n=6 Tax=Entamoeba histolytica TaxID=5759 RepID=C4M6G3_ENTH1|nr:hypothetical protein EHI_099830 [Entamoeba histolytica HM-1:IMSS]EMD49508.1 programmed cell death protein C-terminal domain containing protein [Entamoeba histolytica KU27]EMH75157.1 programmed cell death protein 2 domain containing protein [Entamoeba histolytica HM-1:IMSS-B]EMS13741.1 programmed cell death protein 2 domain containing protein [Entamoeba histolytica HM-3:IMSS]ENY63018.1 programmed cell death protein 2, C-terminal domain containing protein [Entamoeba histolytica HM-1:IMSS-A]GA|eukprot:XP_651281.1 hypothetical protein EHI_099830 [Entamoeba histolytica HM-1:IMSS]